jgi:hypothetical protein
MLKEVLMSLRKWCCFMALAAAAAVIKPWQRCKVTHVTFMIGIKLNYVV